MSWLGLQRGSELGEPEHPGMGGGTGKEGSCAALGLMLPNHFHPPGQQLEHLTQRSLSLPGPATCLGLGPAQATLLSLYLSPHISLPWHMLFSLDVTF